MLEKTSDEKNENLRVMQATVVKIIKTNKHSNQSDWNLKIYCANINKTVFMS